MKNFVCALFTLILSSCYAGAQERIGIMFWNVENFFDYFDGGQSSSDEEFSSFGARRWTKKKFLAKCSAIAKTIMWEASAEGLPDIVGFAEIENAWVMKKMLETTVLRKTDYGIIHFESEDERGIDVGMIYRKSRLSPVKSFPAKVEGIKTRDILVAQFILPEGDSLAVLVNHHPSKYGGGPSEAKRSLALERMVALADSLALEGWRDIVAIGDFNEDARNGLFDGIEPGLVNLGRLCKQGSIRFDGVWELIDNAFVSPGLSSFAEFGVLEPPFLTEKDSAHSGTKPLRTYSGPQYKGGVSDHYPIMVILNYLLY